MMEPGQILDGKYRIVRLIGEGGMGAVFEGENMRISRRVAIKVLHGAALANSETVQRFEREAQAAGRIGSDHILEILDLGTLPDGERYMVMEFLAGETLSDRIRQAGMLPPAQIVHLIRQALVGLSAAHNAGIVHRDLKPDNVFVLREKAGIPDFVKLIDFGISKFNALGSDMSMTRTGAVMGTPYYMSPEQAKGSGDVDQRSDLYAMGVIMYEAATGSVPFNANTFNELLFKIVLSDPRPLLEVVPHIDPRFAQLVARAMARDPAQRFSSAGEMIQALDALQLAPSMQTGAYAALPVAPVAAALPAGTFSGTINPGHAGTQGTFSASQTGVPKRSSGPLLAAAVGGVLLLLGGGAYALLGSRSEPEGAAAASASAVPVVAPSAPAEPARVEPAPAPVASVAAPVASIAAPASAGAPGAPRASAAAALPAGGKPHAPGAVKSPPKPAAPVKPSSGSPRDFGY